MAGVTEEVGKQVGSIVSVIGQQPLSLALVIMNLVLLGYLFYMGTSTTAQRKETTQLVIDWQKENGKILANCVSAETTRTMLDNMQKITDTMLTAEQKEIQRMQSTIDQERNRSWELRERERKELEQLKRERQEPPQPKAQRLSSPVFKLNLPPLPPLPPGTQIRNDRPQPILKGTNQ